MKGEDVKSIMWTFRAISSPELFAVPYSFLPLPPKEIIWSCPKYIILQNGLPDQVRSGDVLTIRPMYPLHWFYQHNALWWNCCIINVTTFFFFFSVKATFFALISPHIFQNAIGNSSGFLLSVTINKFSNMSVLLILFQLLE